MQTIQSTPGKALAVILGLAGLLLAGQAADAQKLSPTEHKEMTAFAKTAPEHRRLAAHYRAHAAEHEADAKLHEEIANQYSKTRPFTDAEWDMARDASHYAQHSREAAEALLDLAAVHESLADEAAEKE